MWLQNAALLPAPRGAKSVADVRVIGSSCRSIRHAPFYQILQAVRLGRSPDPYSRHVHSVAQIDNPHDISSEEQNGGQSGGHIRS